jgi:succinate dehydrogenase / fumarate reductase flavoprotein subunit
MEVGPTCHYVMGGIEVDPDTGAATTPGLFAAGECSGGMHGSNRLGGNSLSDLLVFGRRAGLGAADYVRAMSHRPAISQAAVDEAAAIALTPFNGPQGNAKPENPYTLHADLQQTMNDLVGIIRTGAEMQQALDKIEEFKVRFRNIESAGRREFNPGWHLAMDMRNMLLVSECVARSALARTESRGGHTRDDYPKMDSGWRHDLAVCRSAGDDPVMPTVTVTREEQAPMREDLLELFELEELGKYFTDEELAAHPGRRSE